MYLVFQKPVDDLEEVLGIDVPPIPEISLSSVTKDAILLYWKPSETYHSPLRQCVQINGINIEEFEHSDGSVQLTGLQPGSSYGIRAIATNNAGNSTYSRLIQVQTIPKDGNHGVRQLVDAEQRLIKKPTSARRVSQPTNHDETLLLSSKQEQEMSIIGESIGSLNATLDALRLSKDGLELDIRRDVEESESHKLEMIQNRDNVKQRLDDQEREYQEKRKQVNELEKQLKSSQRRKQSKDKALQQKKTEWQKRRDDVEKWMEESLDMQKKIVSFKQQKVTLKESHGQRMRQTQEKTGSTMSETKSLENEIKVMGIKVNEKRKTARVMQDEEAKESEHREQQHEIRMARLDADLGAVYAEHYQYDADHQRILEYRTLLAEDRMKNPARYAMLPGVEYSSQLGSFKRNHRPGSRIGGSGFASRPYTTGHTFNSTFNPFPNSLLGVNNRSPFPGPLGLIRNQDANALKGGAFVRSSANQLLPKDLLGDTEDDYAMAPGWADYPHIETINRRSASWDQDPNSPHSMHSASQSALTSPHESFTSIPNFYSMDTDGTSLHSTGSPYHQSLTSTANTAGTRRRTNLFGFGRQRPKSSVHDLPPLGSLKSNQSQSFPLNDPENGSRKKNGYSMWSGPVANLLNRSTNTVAEDDAGPSAFPRKARRGLFGSKLESSEVFDPFDHSSSPRLPSTSSHDIGLSRPSTDSNPFDWMNSEGIRQRISPLGGEWATSTGTAAWSRNHSRRESLQYGSTSNLSLGSLPLEVDEFGLPYKANQPAPIGTERFNIRSKPKITPKLNPAAPSFTARLFTKKEKSAKTEPGTETDILEVPKTKTKAKAKGKSKDKNVRSQQAPSIESDVGIPSEDGSTTQSRTSPRLSRETYSNSQDEEYQGYVAEPTQSLTDPNLLFTPVSATPTMTPTKETLMQRITRKSSSSKFSVAWKERGGLFASRKGSSVGMEEPSTPGDAGEEDTSGDYVGKGAVSFSETGTSILPGTPILGGLGDKEKTGRLSSSWGRVMSMTTKSKAKSAVDRDDKERESVEIDDSSLDD